MTSRPRREDVRSDLLKHAAAAFQRDGYAKASLATIAAEAGYTKGAVYSGFASKPHLFAEVCAERFEHLSTQTLAGLQDVLSSHTDRAGLIDGLAGALTDVTLDTPGRWHLLLAEFRTVALRDASVDAVYKELTARRARFLVDLLDGNAYLGRLGRPVLERAAVILLALAGTLAVEHVLAPETVTREAVRASMRGLLEVALPKEG